MNGITRSTHSQVGKARSLQATRPAKWKRELLRGIMLTGVVLVLGLLFAAPAAALGDNGRPGAGVIYVTSQGLYFDTFVTSDPLPFEGPFQKLEPGAGGISQTEFGPGDVGYLGGRWWIDVNGNGEMDGDDRYFHCPLLGPGRTSP